MIKCAALLAAVSVAGCVETSPYPSFNLPPAGAERVSFEDIFGPPDMPMWCPKVGGGSGLC